MSKNDRHITVFEHSSLCMHKGEKRISKTQFEALERFHGAGCPYFKLIHNGVQFNEFVGVLQVGGTQIEVLPKADKLPSSASVEKEANWRNILIDMLRAVGSLTIQSPGGADLKIRPNSILDLYFERFIAETEYLLRSGLVKQYRKAEGNTTALKGSLQFARHIQQNTAHQERFYVRHTVYDTDHTLHRILYKTLQLLRRINTNAGLHSRIGALLLNFPEMPDIRVSTETFEKLVFTRKTQRYQSAIKISQMILLNYHPDIQKGGNDVLALMFDMNVLWEQFLLVTLSGIKTGGLSVHSQVPKKFWAPAVGKSSRLKPDIWIQANGINIVLDTKWKVIENANPSAADLRQMYVYHEYYGANKVALVYPGEFETKEGWFWLPGENKQSEKMCSVVFFSPHSMPLPQKAIVRAWQEKIRREFLGWMEG